MIGTQLSNKDINADAPNIELRFVLKWKRLKRVLYTSLIFSIFSETVISPNLLLKHRNLIPNYFSPIVAFVALWFLNFWNVSSIITAVTFCILHRYHKCVFVYYEFPSRSAKRIKSFTASAFTREGCKADASISSFFKKVRIFCSHYSILKSTNRKMNTWK